MYTIYDYTVHKVRPAETNSYGTKEELDAAGFAEVGLIAFEQEFNTEFTICVQKNAIFETEKEAQREYEKRVNKYAETIENIYDLIAFAAHHAITGENCDRYAREAYVKRAKELGYPVE